MRNENSSDSGNLLAQISYPVVFVLFVIVAGCTTETSASRRTELEETHAALDARQYDDAVSRSAKFLSESSTGAGSATALYMKGLALEQKTYTTKSEADAGWQQARQAYNEAMGRSPSPRLEAYIRSGLANVAYFQDDYATALDEWSRVYEKIDDPDVQGWVLYRVGICRQRLGQFTEADAVFMAVQERYPNTLQAQRAKEHHGARAFSVQLATFAGSAAADSAVTTLRREGALARKQPDGKGRSIVLIGPFSSFSQAQGAKSRYLSKYPDALIVP